MQHDRYDILWGAVLALLGAAVAAYSAMHYDFGTLRRMGPGFFPVGLGVILAALGAAIAIPAFGRPGVARPFAVSQTIGVVAALLVFGLLLNRLGLVVTTALTVLISSAVAPRGGLGWRLILAVAVTSLTWVLFIAGLNMSVPVWPWRV